MRNYTVVRSIKVNNEINDYLQLNNSNKLIRSLILESSDFLAYKQSKELCIS